MHVNWTMWQVCDSAFPAGAFAHSGGIEAAWQAEEVGGGETIARWVGAAMGQAAAGGVPLVAAAWGEPGRVGEWDGLCDVFLLNHVANRASRAQGQAFLMACARTFDASAVQAVAAAVRGERLAGHWPVVFGAVARALDLPRRQAGQMFLYFALRGAVSSAVRLGIVGALQGQKLQHTLAAPLDPLVDRYLDVPPEHVAQTAPVADLLHGLHDRLYSRLFVS